MLEAQAQSGPEIRKLRVEAGIEAGRKVHDAGGPEKEAQAAAATAMGHWQCAINGHSVYSSLVGAYIDALALWASGEEFKVIDALPFMRRALVAYRSLSACLKILGSDVLPGAPSFLSLIPPTWGDHD